MNRRGASDSVFQNLVIMGIIVSAVAVMGVTYMSGISEDYGVSMDNTSYEVFDRYGSISNELDKFNTTLGGGDTSQLSDSGDIITTLITAGYSSVKLMFNIPGILVGIVDGAVQVLQLPPQITRYVSSIIVALIIFAILAVIMKVRA